MGTRSTITLKTGKNRYQTIYCHWDGYLENNGLVLFLNYKNKRKIKKLLELRSLSVLYSKINPRKNIHHDFDNKQSDVCVSHFRDRDEDINIDIYRSINEIDGQEYDYVFENSKWYVMGHETNGEYIALDKIFIKGKDGKYIVDPKLTEQEDY